MWLKDLMRAIEDIKVKFPTLDFDGTIDKIELAQEGIMFYTSCYRVIYVIYWHFDGSITEHSL